MTSVLHDWLRCELISQVSAFLERQQEEEKAQKQEQDETKATQLGVHRSSVYRWRKHAKALEANKKAGNKYYVRTSAPDALRVRYPVLEKQ
ncbi:hypothetical protein PC112_g12183 [Phytophthora cactorum]|uniref:Uncharacterized protein n=1 Tax=Phytophthora cactorum TaxID=29920 RepID=A0A8T1AXU6_9STRA|nr:hypothetical protein PC112_g12183 [Phytophthora cactorum]KAG2891195.1 hypothetical protein PC115_g19286 [Phytophthora cactorum]